MKRILVIGSVCVVALIGGVIVVSSQTHDATVRRAVEAIRRADEYVSKDEALFEPRLLDAEKTVAEVGEPITDSATRAHLDLCLATEKALRSALSLELTTKSIAVRTMEREYGHAEALGLEAAELDGSPEAYRAEDKQVAQFEQLYRVGAERRAVVRKARENVESSETAVAKETSDMRRCMAQFRSQ